MVPLLKATRQPPDNVDDFRQEFGFLGPAIHAALARARTQSITPTSSAPSLSSGSGMGMTTSRNPVMMSGASASGVTPGRAQPAGANTPGNQPKQYMFVTSRPSTPVQVWGRSRYWNQLVDDGTLFSFLLGYHCTNNASRKNRLWTEQAKPHSYQSGQIHDGSIEHDGQSSRPSNNLSSCLPFDTKFFFFFCILDGRKGPDQDGRWGSRGENGSYGRKNGEYHNFR